MRRKLTASQKRYEQNMTGRDHSRRRYYQDLEWASTIAERFPRVKSIRITHDEFIQDAGGGRVPPSTAHYDRERKALFFQECASHHCMEGQGAKSGHYLTDDVTDMIRNGETSRKGHSVCRGWQDSRRVGQFRCSTSDDFEIVVEYAPSVSSN